jgi:hypothetical protein
MNGSLTPQQKADAAVAAEGAKDTPFAAATEDYAAWSSRAGHAEAEAEYEYEYDRWEGYHWDDEAGDWVRSKGWRSGKGRKQWY